MLTATDLSMHYGGQTLFEQVDLQLHSGKRYGIVGANGSGKSTLLRILAEQEQSSSGVVNRPKQSRLGVLEQDHFQYDKVSILDVVMMGNAELWKAMIDKEALLDRAEEFFDADRYSELEDVVLRFDGYGLEARAGEILEGLGIPSAVHRQPLSSLSGGFKLRVLLAKTLASEPDLLFLDEPTNHLDILAIRWLEVFLQTFRGCVVVVSHDHNFLEAVSTHILDVDYQRVTLYKGAYAAFTQAKEAERERQDAEITKRQKEIEGHKAFIARFSAKATKARQANSRQKRMEKIVIEPLPKSSRREPRFRFESIRPSGRTVIKARGIRKAYDDNVVLSGVDLEVNRGDRVAVIGPNGIGKSTLLKIFMAELEQDDGTVEWGHETHPGYFPQDHSEALGADNHTVLSCLWEVLPEEGRGAILSRLAQVLFDRDDSDKTLGNLSGGEASRLLFARISSRKPNVLVLDEPTNHLDLEGISSLATALRKYDGTLIFVSHDRWFVERLATRIVDISHEGVTDFHGSYREYLNRTAASDHLDAEAVVARDRAAKRKRKKRAKAAPETAVAPEPPAAQQPTDGPPTDGRRRGRRGKSKGAKPAAKPTQAVVASPAPPEPREKSVVRRKAKDAPSRRRRGRRGRGDRS